MKFSKLVKAQAVFENTTNTFGARNFNFISEQNPTQNGVTWVTEGFTNITGKLVKRIFLTGGTMFFNGDTGYGGASGVLLSRFTITIKDIYGRLVIDRLPLSALDLKRGKFFTQQFSIIPDFSQSYITMPGTYNASIAFNFCFDIAYNREETNQRKQTFEKLNA